MDTKEKQILVTVITSFLIIAGYSYYVYLTQVVDNIQIIDDVKFWGKSFLILIPVALIGQIIVHIIFAIINKIVTNEDLDHRSDERDKLIELKTIRISHWVFTGGFLLAMSTLAMGMQIWVMFIVLLVSGFIASLLSELMKIYYYRRGI
jgi:hypothetical protein